MAIFLTLWVTIATVWPVKKNPLFQLKLVVTQKLAWWLYRFYYGTSESNFDCFNLHVKFSYLMVKFSHGVQMISDHQITLYVAWVNLTQNHTSVKFVVVPCPFSEIFSLASSDWTLFSLYNAMHIYFLCTKYMHSTINKTNPVCSLSVLLSLSSNSSRSLCASWSRAFTAASRSFCAW